MSSLEDDRISEIDRKNTESIARISIRMEDPPLEVGDPASRDEDPIRYCEDCHRPLKEWEDDICTNCANPRGNQGI